MILSRSFRLSMARTASTVTTVLVALVFARTGVATLEAAQAPETTEVSRAIAHDIGQIDEERPLLAEEPHRAAIEAAAGDPVKAGARTPHEVPAPKNDHMFGVLPNYTMVEEGGAAPRLTTRQTFQMAALSSFDPYVFPFVGVVTAMNHSPGESYQRRYATSLADNSIGNFLTTAVMPLAMRQDPRYFESGEGGVVRRVAYAASRSVITHGRSGQPQFNVSEIGGNAIAAGLSNLYYTPAQRTVTGTLTRWGMQVMWDTLSNEMKEFWPDIRRKLHHEERKLP
jgi:hypothetical protein